MAAQPWTHFFGGAVPDVVVRITDRLAPHLMVGGFDRIERETRDAVAEAMGSRNFRREFEVLDADDSIDFTLQVADTDEQLNVLNFGDIRNEGVLVIKSSAAALITVTAFAYPDRMRNIADRLKAVSDRVAAILPEGFRHVYAGFIRQEEGCWVASHLDDA